MAQGRFRSEPPEKRPIRRWDTVKAIGTGMILGLIVGAGYGYFGVRTRTLTLFILWMIGGAASGAVGLGILVELRNRILGAV